MEPELSRHIPAPRLPLQAALLSVGNDNIVLAAPATFTTARGHCLPFGATLRPGGVNFVTGGECSLYGFPALFNSDGRNDPNSPFYSALAAQSTGGRDSTVQCFALDANTLTQTPLCKAFDSAFGRCCTNEPTAASDQISRFGGDLAALDDGNFVSVVEDRSGFLIPVPQTLTPLWRRFSAQTAP